MHQCHAFVVLTGFTSNTWRGCCRTMRSNPNRACSDYLRWGEFFKICLGVPSRRLEPEAGTIREQKFSILDLHS